MVLKLGIILLLDSRELRMHVLVIFFNKEGWLSGFNDSSVICRGVKQCKDKRSQRLKAVLKLNIAYRYQQIRLLKTLIEDQWCKSEFNSNLRI